MTEYEESSYQTSMDLMGNIIMTGINSAFTYGSYQSVVADGLAQYGDTPEAAFGIVAGLATAGFGYRALENGKELVEKNMDAESIDEYLEGE